MKRLYVFLILLCGLFPVSAGAQESSVGVIISEVNWAGSAASNADEWLELYNGSGETVDLGGWVLAGAATSGDALAIEEGIEIGEGETLLIANYAADAEKSSLTVEPDLATSSLSLSNSGIELYLAMADGTIVDQVDEQMGSSNPFVSMERDLETLEWATATESMNLNDKDQLGTPGSVPSLSTGELEEVAVEEPLATTDACMYDIAVLQAEIEHLEALLALATETSEGEEIEELEIVEEEHSSESEQPESAPEEVVVETHKDAEEVVETAPTPYQVEDVLINELVSNPKNGEEWIELLFMTDVDLDEWTIEDATGKSTVLEGAYEAGDFLVIESPKGQLNNSGDSVLLYDGSGQLIDSITYGEDHPAPEKGEALARTLDSEWTLTTELTPGKKNMFPVMYTEQLVATDEEPEDQDAEKTTETVESEEEITHIIVDIAESVEEVVETPDTETTDDVPHVNSSMSGVITALPGTFGKQIAFINGQQLYFYHAEWPELSLGDTVEVSGEFSSARGESRLKISHVDDIVVTGSEHLEAYNIDIADMKTIEDGTLVRINGLYISRDGDRLMLEDDTDSLPVIAHANTGISWANYASSNLTITGIVRTIDGEARLYPRSIDDIVEVMEEFEAFEAPDDALMGITDTTAWGPWIGGTILTTTGAVLAYWFVKYRSHLNSQPISV